MEIRKLGNSGLDVSALCLGGNVFGWTADEAASFKILDAFAEAGGTFIDTADVYSRWVPGHRGGESETIIGNWMKARGNRNKMIIATKVGMEMGPGKSGLSKKHIMEAVEGSLQRLQTDRIDLYISHKEDDTVPPEETSETYGVLIKAGKIRVAGASNYSGKRLMKSIQASHRSTSPAYQSLQPLYNLYDRGAFERDLEPVCREFHLGVTPYYSLASGFLTGKYRTADDAKKSSRGSKAASYLDDRGTKILAAMDKVAKTMHANHTQVALAWLMSRKIVTSPIASASTPEQVKDLVAGVRLKLDPSQVEILDKASDPGIF